MLRRLNLGKYVVYSLVAALLYGIAAFIFIRRQSYADIWVLYVGNFLFMAVITYFMFSFNQRRDDNASSTSMVFAGHATTVMGTIFAVLLSLLMLALIPGFFHSGEAARTLHNEPVMPSEGNTGGLSFALLMSSIFGNVSVGSFVSLIFSFTIKRVQTKESKELKHREL